MTKVEQMVKNARVAEGMTLAQVRELVESKNVDTDAAVALAAQVEQMFLPGYSRQVRIAVFLSGLLANLIEGE